MKKDFKYPALEQLKNALKIASENYSQIKTERDKFEARMIELETNFTQNDSSINSLIDDYSFLQKINQNQDELIDQLQRKVVDLNEKLVEVPILRDKNHNFEKLTNELTAKIVKLESELEKIPELESIVKQTQESLTNSKEENAKLRQQVDNLEEYQSNFGYAQKEITRRNFDLHNKLEEIEKLKLSNAELTNRLFKLNNIEKELIDAENLKSELEHKSQNLENENSSLKAEIDNLKSNFSKDKQNFEDKINKYFNETKQQASALENYSNRFAELSKEKSGFSEIINSKESEIRTLNERLNLEKGANKMLAEDLLKMRANLEDANSIIERAKIETDIAYQKISALDEELRQKKEEISVVSLSFENEKSEKSDIENQMVNLHQQIRELENKVGEYQNEIEIRNKELQERNESIHFKNQSLQLAKEKLMQLDKVRVENEIEIQELSSALAELSNLKESYDLQSLSFQEIQVELEQLQRDFKQKIDLLEKSEQVISIKNNEISKLNDSNSSLAKKIEELEHKNRSVIELGDALLPLKSENSRLKDELESIIKQVANLEQQIREQQQQIEIANDEKNREIEKVEFLNSTTQSLRETLISKEEEHKLFVNKIGELQVYVGTLEQEIAEIQTSKSILESEIANSYNLSSEKLNQIKDELSYSATSIETLNGEILRLQNELINRSNELKDLAEENLDLQVRLEELNFQISNLRTAKNELEEQINNDDSQILISKLTDETQNLINELDKKELQIKEILANKAQLENLLRSRYEQIEILEKQINEFLDAQKEEKVMRLEIADKIDTFIANLQTEVAN